MFFNVLNDIQTLIVTIIITKGSKNTLNSRIRNYYNEQFFIPVQNKNCYTSNKFFAHSFWFILVRIVAIYITHKCDRHYIIARVWKLPLVDERYDKYRIRKICSFFLFTTSLQFIKNDTNLKNNLDFYKPLCQKLSTKCLTCLHRFLKYIIKLITQ